MKKLKPVAQPAQTPAVIHSCNHPQAVIVNPSESELRELEAMLASCPNCSRWSPGDGPIMAVISTEATRLNDDHKAFR